MKHVKLSIMVILTLSIFHGCSHPGSQNWAESMRGMAESYENLAPYIYNSRRFSDPKNRKFISTYLSNLKENSKGLNQHTGKGLSGDDPLFQVGINRLKDMIDKASESYYVESYDYSQNLLQSSINYCITCHSRTSMGPTFVKWDAFAEDGATQLDPIDHANLLVATRQFPRALEVLEQALAAQTFREGNERLGLERAMTLSIKNLESPSKAHEILSNLDLKNWPKEDQNQIKRWKTYLAKWKSGQFAKKEPIKNVLQKVSNDKTNNLLAGLRQSLILHEALSTEVNKNTRARIYSALGNIYEKYPSMGFWNLPENYYETCIRENPGSKTSLRCYYSLEKFILQNSKAPTVASLPGPERRKLSRLKLIASSKPNTDPGSYQGTNPEDF